MASALKPLRRALSDYEDGAFLYASFGVHWRAGVASLIPFGIIYFTTQPFGSAMTALTTGGFIIGPGLIALFATGWAAMSYGLLHVLRHETRTWLHYAVYAAAGAVALFVVAMTLLFLVRLWNTSTPDVWNSDAFTGFLWATPLLGAISAIIGRRVLATGIRWTVLIERPPLPNALTFVEGKHDKSEFERM